MMLMIAGFFTLGLAPIVSKMERYMPRAVAILCLYVIFFGLLTVLVVQVLPIIFEQLMQILSDLKALIINTNTHEIRIPGLERFAIELDMSQVQTLLSDNLTQITQNVQSLGTTTLGIVGSVLSGVGNIFLTATILFFMLLEREIVADALLIPLPKDSRAKVIHNLERVQNRIADWFRAQIYLMVSIGVAMYIGMKILEYTLGMPYALTISLVAGMMELFPYIGVLITGLLATIIALNISGWLALLVMAWIALIQFLEGNILVPMIMERVIGLPAVASILALAVGATLGSYLGGLGMAVICMILAFPVAAIIAIFVAEYERNHKDPQ
jgi:predicted PurR-regulated permease PerM